jgi:hypothetical protein
MQDQDRPGRLPCGCSAAPDKEAELLNQLEGVVLRELLDPPNPELGEHLDDLSRELHRERIVVEAVVGRLVAVGLVTREGDWVKPAPVALHFKRVNAGWAS